jgi:CubicO group peptidase (beta-lactamase class C family)
MRKRAATSFILALALSVALPESAPAQTAPADAGPRFRSDGPDADGYGRRQGYPACVALAYVRDLGCRVGALSNFDALFPARRIAAPPARSHLARAAAEPRVAYRWNGENRTLDDYLDSKHVTGLLIARGDTILVERYQYGRTDRHRMASFSMAKTVVGLLILLAADEGAIRSLDDPAQTYVPGLEGSAYGQTPIRHLLQMTSGIAFEEVYTNPESDVSRLARLALGQDPGGSLAALRRFNTRVAPPGRRFHYSSAESLVLGLVLSGAVRRTVADYAREKLWAPLGAEADASWNTDGTGQEITFAFFNAVLRDWARLGLMLANDGIWNGREIVPKKWMLAATSVGPESPFWSTSLKPGAHAPGYGYQVWLLPSPSRSFALRGLRGQFVYVDPETKLVLVQTALRDRSDAELDVMWDALRAQFR